MKKEPKAPKVKKEPKAPKVKEPKAPKAKEPKAPKVKEPKAPKVKEPKAPKVKEPKTPKVKEPKAPKVKESKAPKVKESKAPKYNKHLKTHQPYETIANGGGNPSENVIILKKRGRKPKGGKIIVSENQNDTTINSGCGNNENNETLHHPITAKILPVQNIILHLKCNYNDLKNNSMEPFKYEPIVEPVESYTDCTNLSENAYIIKDEDKCQTTDGEDGDDDDTNGNDAHTTHGANNNNSITTNNGINTNNGNNGNNTIVALSRDFHPNASFILNSTSSNALITTATIAAAADTNLNNGTTNTNTNNNNNANNNANNIIEMRELWKKINKLKIIMHKDGAHYSTAQHSACFWCTYEFDTPSIYIPKLFNKNSDAYTVYGCFCSPECATAFLMKEPIDTSVRFERYHLLNSMYNRIYNYDKSIKPAPDPHYLLNKFYGNLSIEEFRKLLKSDHLLYVVNKPLTHSLPELYEDNNEFMVNNKTTIPNTLAKNKKR